MLLLCLLMSPGGTVSDVLSGKSLSCCVLSWLCSYYWFWPARLSGSASQILDVTHRVHLLFKSSGFESPQQLEPACSKGDAWGCWFLLVTLAWLLEEVLQGCWSHATSRHGSSAPPGFYPLWVSCCLVPTPLPFSYRSRFMTSVCSPPAFLRVPSNGSNSMYWNASYSSNASELCLVSWIRKLIWQSTCKLYPYFL